MDGSQQDDASDACVRRPKARVGMRGHFARVHISSVRYKDRFGWRARRRRSGGGMGQHGLHIRREYAGLSRIKGTGNGGGTGLIHGALHLGYG